MSIKTVPLKPLRDLRKIRGSFAELTSPTYFSCNPIVNDYVQITLTDEDDVPNAMSRLQLTYKNALELKYDNARTRAASEIYGAEDTEIKTPLQLFAEFFKQQNNVEMSDEQAAYMQQMIEKIEEEEV